MTIADRDPYDYRNCLSLFGYASAAHVRSGGICALCGFGRGELDFDAWRQLTVEHLIGESQGGYKRDILMALTSRFPLLEAGTLNDVASRLDALNTVTACSFCNSTTSRTMAPTSMWEVIAAGPDDVESLVPVVGVAVEAALARKLEDVKWKLASVRSAYDSKVAPRLRGVRAGAAEIGAHK